MPLLSIQLTLRLEVTSNGHGWIEVSISWSHITRVQLKACTGRENLQSERSKESDFSNVDLRVDFDVAESVTSEKRTLINRKCIWKSDLN